MKLEPCQRSVTAWGVVWLDWLAALYRYLMYRETYHVRSGSVTLAVAPATTTTVTDSACMTTSVILLESTNAAAAAERGGTAMFISTKNDGSFIITHASDAGSRTFDYTLINE